MATTDPMVHPDALELAELLRPAWAVISDSIPAWHPRNEGDDDGAGDGDDDGDGDGGAAGATGDDDVAKLRNELRKHRGTERRAKQAEKERDALKDRIQELEGASQSDQEKALEQAREEARREALSEAEKERRQDRLEVAVTRLAAKGVKVGSGDDAKTLRFEDPEDALVFIEREIARGDLDADDIFDKDGRVQTDAVTEALADLLQRKPKLAAGNDSTGGAAGDADGGKGSSGGMTAEDVRRLAKENPREFTRKLEAGEIPVSALGATT